MSRKHGGNGTLRLRVFFRKAPAALIVCLGVISVASAQRWSDNPAIEDRVDALLQQMSLEEKLGQMSQYSGGMPTGPGTGRTSYEEMIANGQVSSLLNVSGQDANRYQKIAVEQSRLKIPLIFGLDVIHGYRTIFPIPLALSATWNPALVEKSAAIAAIEARADGVRWTFSPMVDIARDARWGRIAEGAGEDPYLGSMMARAYIRGYQGKSPSEKTSILACMKHYVGYGAAEGGRDYNTTEIPERLLRQVYLPPFKAGLDAGAATVMSAFNALNGVPASANPFTLDQILRREWQFKGFVVSDWTAIAETIAHGTAIDSADAARKSVLAGVDMDMESDLYRTVLAGQVKAGKVPVSTIDDAVRRILRVKFAIGLFEDPYARLEPNKMLLPAHRQAAREAAEKSFVLLRNEGLLPLKPGARVALIGPLADSAARHAWFLGRQRRGRRCRHLANCIGDEDWGGARLCEGDGHSRQFRKRIRRSDRGRSARRHRHSRSRRERAGHDRGGSVSVGTRSARKPAKASGSRGSHR